MSLPNNLDLDALVRWDAAGSGSGVEVGRARLKELRTLGHKVERFLAAREACWKSPALGAARERGWLRRVGAPAAIEGEGLFSCLVLPGESGFHLPQVVLERDLTERLVLLWQRTDPDAPKSSPAVLSVSPDANAPLWLALLRLRPLRDLWEHQLRRATLQNLLELLPAAWMLDATPLPPGAVIPGLELAEWSQLSGLRASGRRFMVAPAQQMRGAEVLDEIVPLAARSSAVEQALQSFPTEPRVLVELADSNKTSAPLLIAFYEKKGGRVEGLGVLALTADAEGRYVPARITRV